MAEFYRIYDYGLLPIDTVATLVFGLGDNSRVKMRLNGVKAPTNTILLAEIADRLGGLLFGLNMIGEKPEPIATSYYENTEDKPKDFCTFTNGADFEKAWKERSALCQT